MHVIVKHKKCLRYYSKKEVFLINGIFYSISRKNQKINPVKISQKEAAVKWMIVEQQNIELLGKPYVTKVFTLKPLGKPYEPLHKKASNCTADQGLCFCYTDSTIPLLHKSEISSF